MDGANSFSIFNSQIICYVNYSYNVNSYEKCAIAFVSISKVCLFATNFINTSESLSYCIFISSTSATFSNCIFLNSHSTFLYPESNVQFIDCLSDDNKICRSCTLTEYTEINGILNELRVCPNKGNGSLYTCNNARKTTSIKYFFNFIFIYKSIE